MGTSGEDSKVGKWIGIIKKLWRQLRRVNCEKSSKREKERELEIEKKVNRYREVKNNDPLFE